MSTRTYLVNLKPKLTTQQALIAVAELLALDEVQIIDIVPKYAIIIVRTSRMGIELFVTGADTVSLLNEKNVDIKAKI